MFPQQLFYREPPWMTSSLTVVWYCLILSISQSYSNKVVRIFGTFSIASYTPKIFRTDAFLAKALYELGITVKFLKYNIIQFNYCQKASSKTKMVTKQVALMTSSIPWSYDEYQLCFSGRNWLWHCFDKFGRHCFNKFGTYLWQQGY